MVATLTERPVVIAPIEVLVRVKAVAINPADEKMIDEGHRVTSWPLAPGLDGAGNGEGMGANMKPVALGAIESRRCSPLETVPHRTKHLW